MSSRAGSIWRRRERPRSVKNRYPATPPTTAPVAVATKALDLSVTRASSLGPVTNVQVVCHGPVGQMGCSSRKLSSATSGITTPGYPSLVMVHEHRQGDAVEKWQR